MNPLRLGLLAPLSLLTAAQAAPDPQVIGFPEDVVEAHRLSGSATIAVPAAMAQKYAGQVGLRITIDTAGKVTDVRADGSAGDFGDPAPAIAAARQWTFRPFQYRDHPVAAQANIRVSYRFEPTWADPQAAFPAIDYDTLRIELSRGACFGPCPVYTVSIAGDGTVTYRDDSDEGAAGAVHRIFNRNGTLVSGTHRTKIDRAALDGLIEQFRAARFFGLKKEYQASITDSPTYRLRFSTGGQSMEVVDYVGQMIDMPEAVTALEGEVDRVSGSARWVKGDETTLPGLLAEGFDPRAPAAADLALGVRAPGGEAVVLGLLAAGMPLDRMVKDARTPKAEPLGRKLLANALRAGMPKVALALIERGWLAKMPAAERAKLFAETAGGCDPAVARAMVAAGVNPNARIPATEDFAFLGGGSTALHVARVPYSACRPLEDRGPLVRALIALGTDPNAADGEGETPIYGIEDPDLLATFLAAGARADVKDKNGNSPAFGSWTDLIVLMLLEAGADPRGKEDGKTLPMLAREKNMPATRAWLEAHGIR
jgi:TonB family protein